jgi:protein-S-isoprenylcysteine O-methyltransferase Ste14
MTEFLIFAAVTLCLIAISWSSLRRPGTHGFYRFFAWEAICALIFLNHEFWFLKPFTLNQIISWILLITSIVPLVYGIQRLRTTGRPDKDKRTEPGLLGFERTTHLVTDGIYRFIRHPLYSSLFLLDWGVYFKSPSAFSTILACLAAIFLFATAKADERECIQAFGDPYRKYMKHTKMFIPYVL